jgi:hypothetical protein
MDIYLPPSFTCALDLVERLATRTFEYDIDEDMAVIHVFEKCETAGTTEVCRITFILNQVTFQILSHQYRPPTVSGFCDHRHSDRWHYLPPSFTDPGRHAGG